MNLVGRNLMWLLVSQLATWVMTLAVIILMPRYLGDEGLGDFSTASAYVGFFTLAAGLGTSMLLAREIARDHSLVGTYVFNGVVLKLLLVTVLAAAALGLGFALDLSNQLIALVAVGCVGMYFVVINEVLVGGLSGMQRMGKSSVWMTCSVYFAGIGGLIVLANDGGVVSYAIVVAAATVLPVIGNTIQLWPMVRDHFHIDPAIWKIIVRGGLPLMLLTVFNQIYNTIDIPILAAIAGTATVGWYSLAYKWAAIPIFITTAVAASHYPEMSLRGPTGGPEFVTLVNRAIKLVLLASIPAAVGLAVIAADLIDLLYEPEFAPSARPLQILALQIPITALDTLVVTALIASNRLRKYLVVAGIAAVLNPLVNVVTINLAIDAFDNGAIGAAIATASTELFVMTCAFVLSAPGVMDWSTASWSLRCGLAGASIVLVALFADATPIGVQVALGVVCFGVASLVLRVISVDMLRGGARQAIDMVASRRRARPSGD